MKKLIIAYFGLVFLISGTAVASDARKAPVAAKKYYVGANTGDGEIGQGSMWWTKLDHVHNSRNFFSPDDTAIAWVADYPGFSSPPDEMEVVWYKPDGTVFRKSNDVIYPAGFIRRNLIFIDDAVIEGGLGKWKVEAYAEGILVDSRYYFIDYTEKLGRLPLEELSPVTTQKDLQWVLTDMEKKSRNRIATTASKEAFMKAAEQVLTEKGYEVKVLDSLSGTVQTEFAKKDFQGIKAVLALAVSGRNYELGLRYRYEQREKGNFIADLSVGRYVSDKGISEFRPEQMGEFQKELKSMVQTIKERAESNTAAVVVAV